jgi:hypothetical protein
MRQARPVVRPDGDASDHQAGMVLPGTPCWEGPGLGGAVCHREEMNAGFLGDLAAYGILQALPYFNESRD